MTIAKGGKREVDDDPIKSLQYQVKVLQRRADITDRVIAFAASRLGGVLLLLGLLVPMVEYDQDDELRSASLLTFPWQMISDMGRTTSDGMVLGVLFLTGFFGLTFVAIWCCCRLLFWTGEVGIASKIAAWLLIVGSCLAILMFLAFQGMSSRSRGHISVEVGAWFLLAGSIAASVLLLSNVSRWISDALAK